MFYVYCRCSPFCFRAEYKTLDAFIVVFPFCRRLFYSYCYFDGCCCLLLLLLLFVVIVIVIVIVIVVLIIVIAVIVTVVVCWFVGGLLNNQWS